MRKLLSFCTATCLALGLGACEEKPTQPDQGQAMDHQVVAADHGSSDAVRTVTVELEEINDSGISGEATITDDGNTIVVSDGSATGMDPAKTFEYLSLFYDKASPPRGPEACEPGTFDPDHPLFLTDPQMEAAIWAVDGSGNGTPFDLVGDYVSVDMIGTMSIRDLNVNGGFGPEAVVACGKVTHDPANGAPAGR